MILYCIYIELVRGEKSRKHGSVSGMKGVMVLPGAGSQLAWHMSYPVGESSPRWQEDALLLRR
jgi:hypothetical protein